MTKINIADLKKTLYYLKRNGLRDTYLAALERLQQKEAVYVYEVPDEAALQAQRAEFEQSVKAKEQVTPEQTKRANPTQEDASGQSTPRKLTTAGKFSILVPAYRTNPVYLRAMIDSVLTQTYGALELVIADASDDDSVKNEVEKYQDARIKYLRLSENKGISDNTNEALKAATGDYVGLLDHDDVLTPDALYEMAKAVREAEEKGITLQLLYSDEDKCDESGQVFYEPHFKLKFNLDLILSNNYFCHFTVMKAELIKKLCFRAAYDGAQDYDLVLRAVRAIYGQPARVGMRPFAPEAERAICHIPKVLYHWRCHSASTAENPRSKTYAYEAGCRAVDDFLKTEGIRAEAANTRHLGFYKVNYKDSVLEARADVGIVGGKLLDKNNKITGGIYVKTGECPYLGLYKGFSGYMHRAVLLQDADAVDVRLMQIRPELFQMAEAIIKSYLAEKKKEGTELPKGAFSLVREDDGPFTCIVKGLSDKECRDFSIRLCKTVREVGYRIVWNPDWTKKVK